MRSGYNIRVGLCFVTVLFSLFLMAGCGATGSGETEADSETPSGPGPASFIDLRSSDYILTANGKSETTLTATVEDANGDALEGERIDFTVISGLGKDDYIEYLDGRADTSGGVATTTFTAPEIPYNKFIEASDEKKITIQAVAENGVSSDLMDIALGMGRISLNASPPELLADGTSESIITATVTDANGDIVPEEHVNFAITSGSGHFKEFDTDRWRARATTSADGSAQITYIASDTVGPVSINAWVGDFNTDTSSRASTVADYQISAYGYAPAAMNIELNSPGGDGEPASIQLTSGNDSIPANGYSSVTIRATIKNSSDLFVSKGTPVTFTTTLGTISQAETETSDQNGTVIVSLISADTPGTAQVTCTAGSVPQSIDIEFTEDLTDTAPSTIILWADPEKIPADGEATAIIDALVTDKFGKPVTEGTSVFFRTDNGRFSNGKKGEAVTTDKSGSVSVTLRAATTQGIATVTCVVGDETRNITVEFSTDDVIPAIISITPPDPATIPPDNTSSVVIEAKISDIAGMPVPKGTLVSFRTNLGRISNEDVSTPDSTGIVRVSLIAGNEPGTAEVTCKSGNVSHKVTVEITSSDVPSAGSITLTAEPASIVADEEDTSTIDAIIKDKSGAAVPSGTSVIFTTDLGRFSNGRKSEETTTSDNTGTVTVTLTAGITRGTAEILCTAGGIMRRIYVDFTSSTAVEPNVSVTSMTLSTPSPAEIPADGTTSSLITATVKDSSLNSIKGVLLEFSTNMGRLSATSVRTSESGNASVSLIAGTAAGTAEVICRAGNVSQKVTVELTKKSDETTEQPEMLSLDTSQSFVKSDNSDSAEIIVSALDSNYAALEGVTINFSAEGGQLSASTVKTGADGIAKVIFSSGAAKENRTVFITASAGDLAKSVPVKITGTSVKLEADKTNLGQAILTVTVRDAHEDPVYNAEVEIKSVDPEDALTENNALVWELLGPNYTSYRTDVNGELKLKIRGNTRTGEVMLKATSLGATATLLFTVSSVGEEFAISSPAEDPASLHTGDELTITVSAPGRQSVKFTTTFGIWKESGSTILSNVPVADGKAYAVLTSTEAGLATIQVVDEISPGVSDTLKVAISAPSKDAAKIALQASATIMLPSTGDEVNTVDLTATVKNATDQVVGGAPVAFSIENTTGGGESISPVYVLTDDTGVASVKFFSGSLGSDAKGVTVKAIVVDRSDIPASYTSIVIGGTAGSVSLGISSKVVSMSNDTAYSLPMSVIVSDANGNPVPNAEVSLGVWPVNYATGYWSDCLDGTGTCAYHAARTPNEDTNRNLILDPGEDVNLDGELTPLNTAAGNLPSKVTTDENGMAEFNLIYLKRSAVWIEDEITASVVVSGTETRSSYILWLGYQVGDEDNLSHSPFNTEDTATDPYSLTLTATPATLTADGQSSCEIEAVVFDVRGNEVTTPTVVRFATTAGTLLQTSKTTQDGKTTVTLTSPDFVSEATVTATVGTEVKDEITVTFVAGPPAAQYSTVSANPASMSADGKSTSQIQARVSDANGNTVADGTLIVFDSSGSGVLSSRTATTSNGTASVDYTAGTIPGTVTVTAKTGNGINIGSADITLVDTVVNSVSVKSGSVSGNIPADGVSETLITATILDNTNNPVQDGTQVTFTTTAGLICNNASCRTSWEVPTSNGVASVMLRSSENTGTAKVTASAGGVTGTADVEFVSGAVSRIVLSASPDSLQAGGTSSVRALVTDMEGNPVSDGKITFSVTAGGGILSPQTATISDGAATTSFTASSESGQVAITARSANGVSPGTPLIIGVAPDGIGEVLITASRTSIPADGSSRLLVTATVKDAEGNIAPNVPVTFRDVTDVSNPRKLTVTDTDRNGEATFPYTSTLTTGVITIQAEAGTENAETDITQTAGDPAHIKVSAVPDTVYANGENMAAIRAEVKDDNGNLVNDGVSVFFVTTGGTFENSDTAFIGKTENGVAEVQLIAPLTMGTAIVSARVEGVAEKPQISVTFLGIFLSDIAATPPAIDADGISSTEIRVRLKDSDGIAVQGETVDFSTTAGTLDSESAITGEDGIATVNLIAPLAPGSATVTARYGTQGVPENITVNFKPPSVTPIASVSLSADPTSLPADGSSTSSVSATVTAVEGQVEDDTPVEFTITRGGGNFEGGGKTITAYTYGGVAFVILTSGETAETATIQAEVRGRTDEIQVEYTPGSISLLIIPNTILGTRDSTTTVTATLKDVTGVPAAPGERVEFILDNVSMGEFVNELGEIRPSFGETDDQGEVLIRFRSAAQGGVVRVTASWVTDSVEVTGAGDITVQPPPAFIKTSENYPDPDSVNIKGTGGQATSQIIFDVNDSMGNPVADGYRIDFVIMSGPNGREDISPAFGYTVDGKVSTVLRSGSKPGPVSVNATYFYDRSVDNNASLAIVAGPPVGEAFGIYAQYVNISGLWKFGLNNTVTVDAGDFWGNSVPNNTAISFKTYSTGGLFDPGTAATSDGSASNALYSVPNPIPSQGFVSVTAEAINGGRTTHVTSLSVVRDTEHNQILYAGTDGGGAYKSLDSGATWKNISRSSTVQGQNWIDPYINDIAADPDNPNTIYAATGYSGGGNIYRSMDGGLNWNSNNVEEWNGVFATDAAVQTVLPDDDGCDSSGCNGDICYYEYYDSRQGAYMSKEIPCYRYVWIGTKGMGAYFAPDGEHFQWGGSVTTPEPTGTNQGDGTMSRPVISATAMSEEWTVTFYCTNSEDPCGGNWRVSGSKSGLQSATANTNLDYASDNGEVAFVISDGGKSFEQGDNFSFSATESRLGYGTYVYDIVKVRDTHGDSAILYAATGSGIFKSVNGAQTWIKRGSAGDSVNTLALHPSSSGGESDTIYAGTNDTGVWVSTDSGTSWTAYTSGMGKGLSATTPVAGNNNKGYGMMSKVTVSAGCLSETWTVACVKESPNGGVFSVTGTISGPQDEYDITTGEYSIPNMLSFTINDGTGSGGVGGFRVGDTFTFNTTKDPGKYIKDLLVDPKNRLLYAVTYFLGALEPHAVGNLYVHGLNPDGSMIPEDWREANIGLPLYDPPDDISLFAQHVIAADDPDDPASLYIGGEGINFFKAANGLDNGAPVWQESRSGLTNLIMARTPVLFSGLCELEWTTEPLDSGTKHIIYLQDKNGNPPIAGTNIKVTVTDADGNETTRMNRTYSDTLIHKGTWRDPSDPTTNNPYEFYTGPGESLGIVRTPVCGNSVPGCSWGD